MAAEAIMGDKTSHLPRQLTPAHPGLGATRPDQALQLHRRVQPAKAAAQDAHAGAGALAGAGSAKAGSSGAGNRQGAAAGGAAATPAAVAAAAADAHMLCCTGDEEGDVGADHSCKQHMKSRGTQHPPALAAPRRRRRQCPAPAPHLILPHGSIGCGCQSCWPIPRAGRPRRCSARRTGPQRRPLPPFSLGLVNVGQCTVD